jgi:Ala-tRNA(Pro) deacylase
MNDAGHHVRLIIDKEIAEGKFIGCHPCVNTSSLKIATADIMNRFLPHTGHDPAIVTI